MDIRATLNWLPSLHTIYKMKVYLIDPTSQKPESPIHAQHGS
jgi:hypothetical protein